MISRLRAWWAGRSSAERMIFGLGIPITAAAALWANFRDRSSTAAVAAATDSEGGEASAISPATGPSVINTGAPGVGFDQLASFSEVFTSEIGTLEERLGVIEGPGFADSPAIGALRSQFETGLGTLEDELREEIERSTATKTVTEPPAPKPKPAPAPAPDPLATYRSSVINAYQTEGVKPPNAATVNRIALEVSQGRSIQHLRTSIRANERRAGRPTAADSRRYWSSR